MLRLRVGAPSYQQEPRRRVPTAAARSPDPTRFDAYHADLIHVTAGDNSPFSKGVVIDPVPEPSALAPFAVGWTIIGMGVHRRRGAERRTG